MNNSKHEEKVLPMKLARTKAIWASTPKSAKLLKEFLDDIIAKDISGQLAHPRHF